MIPLRKQDAHMAAAALGALPALVIMAAALARLVS
jgi:hypothetical protein